MDIEILRSYIAFVETGSFSRASQQVHKTQSAISQQMKKLEKQTGKALFVKSGRLLSLTEDGKLLLGYARQLVSLNDEALNKLTEKNSQRPLILGCPDDYYTSVMPKVVSLINQQHPYLQLEIRNHNSKELRQYLDNGEIDMAILTVPENYDEGYFLQYDTGVWAYNGDDKTLQALLAKDKLPLVLYDNSCHFHKSAINRLTKLNIAYEIKAFSSSSSAVVNMVKQGIGITAIASESLAGLTEITQNNCSFTLPFEFPFVTGVSIEMGLSAYPHPNFGRLQVEKLARQYCN